MVNADIDDRTHTGLIVLRPNASLSWQANLYVLYFLMVVSLTIGIGFALVGAWMILPYSLLEISVLSACIYVVVQKCNLQEVITVREHEVTIAKGIRVPNKTWKYQRLWAKFLVTPARRPWHEPRICITSHGEELELGSFLTEEEKQTLVQCLKRVVP